MSDDVTILEAFAAVNALGNNHTPDGLVEKLAMGMPFEEEDLRAGSLATCEVLAVDLAEIEGGIEAQLPRFEKIAPLVGPRGLAGAALEYGFYAGALYQRLRRGGGDFP
jgi:hypothetical protein